MNKIKTLLGALAVLFTANIASADRFFTEPVNLVPGTDSMLEFYLDNSQEYVGLQAAISLPSGITVTKWTLSERAKGTSPFLNSNLVAENLVKLAAYSTANIPYSGTEGVLLYASFHVDETFTGGSLSITDIFFSNISDEETSMPDCTVEIGVKMPENKFYLPDFTIKPSETKKVALVLDNETSFRAFQTDICMPEGLSIVPESFVLTSRCNGNFNERTNNSGLTRVAVYADEPFTGNSGDLLSFEVLAAPDATGTLQIEIKNSNFTTDDNKDFTLENTVTNVTIDSTTEIVSITDGVEVSTTGNTLHISGLTADLDVKLYTTDGMLIQNFTGNNSDINVTLEYGQVYILKVGTKTFKLKL